MGVLQLAWLARIWATRWRAVVVTLVVEMAATSKRWQDSFAECACASESKVVLKPGQVTFEQTASVLWRP